MFSDWKPFHPIFISYNQTALFILFIYCKDSSILITHAVEWAYVSLMKMSAIREIKEDKTTYFTNSLFTLSVTRNV